MKSIVTLESRIFSSLAHPKRLEIVHILQHGSATVGELSQMTDIPQANVSQHLSILRRFGIVTSQKDAQIRRYELASHHVPKIMDAMRLLLLEHYGVRDIDTDSTLHLHTDPICGMEIAAHQAASSLVAHHTRYYFCGVGCEKKFKSNPEPPISPPVLS